MNNDLIINKLNTIKDCFYKEYGINLSNKGFNYIDELIYNLKDESIIKGFKGSEKKRISLALKLQKEAFRGSRPLLGLFHYREDKKQVFINKSCSFLIVLDPCDYISGVKTTNDDFIYSDKKTYFSYDPKQKDSYPNTNNLMLKTYNELNIKTAPFMDFINAHKNEQIKLNINDELSIIFDGRLLYEGMILSNNYIKESITFKYIADMKPAQVNDSLLITPIRGIEKDVPSINLKELEA